MNKLEEEIVKAIIHAVDPETGSVKCVESLSRLILEKVEAAFDAGINYANHWSHTNVDNKEKWIAENITGV